MATKFKKQSALYQKPPEPSEDSDPLHYVHVKAVMLYWKDSDTVRDRVMEAEKMESVFKSLNFDTELYPIPTDNSHNSVLAFMKGQATLLALKKREVRMPCLLIVHYSGDGVLGDGHHNIGRGHSESRKRKVVWRPHSGANQSIRWDEILGYLDMVLIDNLLLIDCSYTTQSGGRPTEDMLDKLPRRWQLLTSLSDHSRAELSMEPSFTTVMANVMTEQIKTHNRVVITELYEGLTSRLSHLNISPVLLAGPWKRSIVLEKPRVTGEEDEDEVIASIQAIDWKEAIDWEETAVTNIPALHRLPELDWSSGTMYSSDVPSKSLYGTRSERQSSYLDSIDGDLVDQLEHLKASRPTDGKPDGKMGFTYRFSQQIITDSGRNTGLSSFRAIPQFELVSILKSFAGRLHEEATTSVDWKLSVTLHRKSEEIASILVEDKPSRNESEQSLFAGDNAPGNSSVLPTVEGAREDARNWIDLSGKSILSPEPLLIPIGPAEILLPSPTDCLVTESKAYTWLLLELQLRAQRNFSYPKLRDSIKWKVLQVLRSQNSLRVISNQRPTTIVRFEISLFWELRKYIESLQLPVSQGMWEHVLCLTGSREDLQLASVTTYLRQTWPLSQGHLEHMLVKFLRCRSDQTCSYTFPNTLSVAISSLSTGYCEIEALGGPYMVSEFAEQISWLATALRLSPLQGTVAVLSPRMTISPIETSYKQSPKEMSVTAELDFDVQDNQENSTPTQSTCWTRLFTNPILVSGYPILRKSTLSTGAETSLSIMASIVQAHQIVRIENRIIMKGFNSLLVASAVDGASILWHAFISSKLEDRISYFDPRIMEFISNKDETPLLRSLEDFRHIVGWCSEVTEFCGHPQAELSISASGTAPCPAYTAIDRIYVEGGFYVIGGVNARINQREQPVVFGEARDYSEVFEWVADQFVAFYDVVDRRGWLVDGASALLHLVRMSLQLEETKPESTYHWVFEKDKLEEDWTNFNGRAASIRTLKSWKNRALPLYMKNQTFSNGIPNNTYSTFGDRVDKVLHLLELLIEHQNRIATESGIKVSQTLDTRKGILGFDVLDLVKSRPQCVPRIERFSSGDNSWVSLLPAIGVLTIFGKGFGDLICPSRPDTVCAAWRAVPEGQDYLTSSISTLALLRRERLQQLETELEPGGLTRKLFWVSPGQPFDCCQCTKGKQVGEQEHRDPVQYIVSKPWLRTHKSKETTSVDVSTLDATGAVVFVNLSSLGRRVEARNLQVPAAGPVSSSSHGSLSASASQSTAAQSSSSTAPTETSAQIAGSASDHGGSNLRGDQSISSRLKEKWKGKLRTFYRT